MTKTNSNSGNILIILAIAIAIIAAWALYQSGKPAQVATQPLPAAAETIGSAAELSAVGKSLDNTNIDGPIDQGMNQLQSDVNQIR